MTAMSAGVSVLAHGVHYAVLALGLAGLVVLLGPRFADPRQAPQDGHDLRVAELRRQLGVGGVRPVGRVVAAPTTPAELFWLPFAVVCSAAAAGVHAAVGPAHFREATSFGLFFAAAALLQLVWASAIVLQPSRSLFRAGAAGNLLVVGLWLQTRTVGLPFGLMDRPEAFGPWDLACAAWELAVAGSCLALLRTPARRLRVPSWSDWSGLARGWAALSAVALLALTLSGASA